MRVETMKLGLSWKVTVWTKEGVLEGSSWDSRGNTGLSWGQDLTEVALFLLLGLKTTEEERKRANIGESGGLQRRQIKGKTRESSPQILH